jgi:hypothetical protein
MHACIRKTQRSSHACYRGLASTDTCARVSDEGQQHSLTSKCDTHSDWSFVPQITQGTMYVGGCRMRAVIEVVCPHGQAPPSLVQERSEQLVERVVKVSHVTV